MAEPTPLRPPLTPVPDPPAGGEPPPRFETLVERRPPSLLRRWATTNRHAFGLAVGGLAAHVRARPRMERRGLGWWLLWLLSALTRPFASRRLVELPFPQQLRRRLEMMGATYVKLGQVLALREDLLPRAVTDELANLLDRLPAVSAKRFTELVEGELGPVDRIFSWISPEPLGSASIGQTHRATTLEGDAVILKVVKPGIRETIRRDVVLLRTLGSTLQLFLPRLQPKRVIDEFCHYTLREVDLLLEADNAETFAANFSDMPGVVFPSIHRRWTTRNVLCMSYLDGFKPGSPKTVALTEAERDHLVDLGAEAIIRMLYRDGFFHADLHPGNLIVLPGPRLGFIDLGMVGRFSGDVRRNLLYYYYTLVAGDAVNAARFLAALAEAGPGGDPDVFRREVEEICQRWSRDSSFDRFSLGQLIMRSIASGIRYRMYFPVEMVLMVKAIVTFEAVGHTLKPKFDVAAVSQRHINRIFLHQFNPVRIARDGLRGAPELVDALVKAPMLVTEGLRVLEQHTRRPPQNPLAGLRGTLLAGSCLVTGGILAAFDQPWPLWASFFAVGFLLALRTDR